MFALVHFATPSKYGRIDVPDSDIAAGSSYVSALIQFDIDRSADLVVLQRIAYALDHPEYSIRWASDARLRMIASVLENISARHGIPTRLAHRSSTSKTKRVWVGGDGRMTQIGERDRAQNASRRTQAMLTWWRTATQDQIDATITKRRNT